MSQLSIASVTVSSSVAGPPLGVAHEGVDSVLDSVLLSTARSTAVLREDRPTSHFSLRPRDPLTRHTGWLTHLDELR